MKTIWKIIIKLLKENNKLLKENNELKLKIDALNELINYFRENWVSTW